MNLVAASFAWPFRGRLHVWLIGCAAVLLLPLAFIPLFGYAVAATRSAAADPDLGPPSWRISARLLADGFWTALLLLLLTAPFAIALGPLAAALDGAHIWRASDAALSRAYAYVGATFILALPWGLLLLLLLPHGVLRFSSSGRAADLFDFVSSIRGVRRDFPTWNLAAAAIVTAWAVGLACAGLLCVGALPGIFYAILVSTHASAALEGAHEARPTAQGAHPPPR